MKYGKLGTSELKVSRICMGCMGFGDAGSGQHSWTVSEPISREIIKKGLALGINFFDTAIAYQNGTSEQYLGRALRFCKARRGDDCDKISAAHSGRDRSRNYRAAAH